MRKTFVLAAGVLGLSILPALSGGAPPGWQLEGYGAGFFEVGTEQTEGAADRNAAFIRAKSADGPAKAEAELVQRVDAAPYAGKRLRLSTRLKTSDVNDARSFMTVSGAGKVLKFFSLAPPVSGTTSWHDYDVVLDIPANAERIKFGFVLFGKGKVWADGFRLEPVSRDVTVSAQPLPAAPVNLNFDP